MPVVCLPETQTDKQARMMLFSHLLAADAALAQFHQVLTDTNTALPEAAWTLYAEASRNVLGAINQTAELLHAQRERR